VSVLVYGCVELGECFGLLHCFHASIIRILSTRSTLWLKKSHEFEVT
jgi:hypothetical protein